MWATGSEEKKENKREDEESARAEKCRDSGDSRYERNRDRSVAPVSTVRELIIADPYKSGLSHFDKRAR